MKKQMKTGGIGFYILILAIIFVAVYVSGVFNQSSNSNYNIASFREDWTAGNVDSVEILPNEEVPTGEIHILKSDGSSVNFYVSDVKEIEELVLSDPALAKRCKVNNIQKPSWVITTLLPYGLSLIHI